MSRLSFAKLLAFVVCMTAVPLPAHAIEVRARELVDARGAPLCLDVDDGRAENGTDLLLWTCHGGTNQRWRHDAITGEIRSAMGNFCVDVDKGRAFQGNKVQLWTCNGSAAQRFSIANGAVSLRSDPAYCLDGGDRIENAGARLKLWTCNGTPPQRLVRESRYGQRRFDELTWLTSHNAFANTEDARWIVPNQSRGLARQLRDGVRAFMLDAHSYDPETWRCVASFGADCGGHDVYLCHGNCGGVPGVGYALPRQTLSGSLATIVRFLQENPDELVTVFLEDYSRKEDLRRVLDGVPGLRRLQFDPAAWNVASRGWPRVADLVDADRRLLVFSDRWDRADLGVHHGAAFTVENYWSMGGQSPDYSCRPRWGDVPLDRRDAGFNRLFVMNHFRDLATTMNASADNAFASLLRRANDYCVGVARRKPNYVAVDFYETGGGGGPRSFVEDVDQATAILFQHGDHVGRAQLVGPGTYLQAALTVGNDALSALVLLPGTIATLYEHDDLRGRMRIVRESFESAGAGWNDVTSSLVIHADTRHE